MLIACQQVGRCRLEVQPRFYRNEGKDRVHCKRKCRPQEPRLNTCRKRQVRDIPADSVSSSHGVCDGGSCDFGDLAPGTVIQLQMQREILGGGISARCNGDVFEVSGRVAATTNDPVPGNNIDTVSPVAVTNTCAGRSDQSPTDTRIFRTPSI